MLSDPIYQRFLSSLPPDRVRIQLHDLWQALGVCFPAEVGSGQGRKILAALIERLVTEGFRLPSTRDKTNFDRLDQPPLPQWVSRPQEKEKCQGFHPGNYLWAEELSFLSRQNYLRNHELWLLLDKWFKSQRNKGTENIPLRERSYEIFRDEKALDGLRKTAPFVNGDISLKTLHCFIVYEPLPTELGPASAQGRPALVVENQTTYWTIAHWNKAAGRYACVIYGGGNKFSVAWEWVKWKQKEFGFVEVKYFGDIDVTGIEIPIRAGKAISIAQAFPFSLDVDLYRVALRLEKDKDPPLAQGKIKFTDNLLEIFPEDIRGQIGDILWAGQRIPQETITFKALESLGNPICELKQSQITT